MIAFVLPRAIQLVPYALRIARSQTETGKRPRLQRQQRIELPSFASHGNARTRVVLLEVVDHLRNACGSVLAFAITTTESPFRFWDSDPGRTGRGGRRPSSGSRSRPPASRQCRTRPASSTAYPPESVQRSRAASPRSSWKRMWNKEER